ncbi:hypothetical protein [Paraburkholderia heleia]|nr:hypothetical protein [Paraburkholderia heleia]
MRVIFIASRLNGAGKPLLATGPGSVGRHPRKNARQVTDDGEIDA